MENEDIVTRSYFLTSSKVRGLRIRNGHLWFLCNDNFLSYCNLNSKPLKIRQFEQGGVDFFSVSPNGEYCFVHTSKRYYMLSAGAELPHQELKNIPAEYVATSTSWLYIRGFKKPHLFFGTNAKLICCLNLNQSIVACTFIPIVDITFTGAIDGIFITQFADDHFGMMLSSNSELFYVILSADFIQQKDPKNRKISFPISPKIRNAVFSENRIFSIISETVMLKFAFDSEQNAPSVDEIMNRPQYFDIERGTISFTFFANLMLHFTTDRISFFDQNGVKPFYSLRVPAVDMFEMDSATGDLYSIRGSHLNHYQFDSPMNVTGFDSLRIWLFYRLLAAGQEREAAVEIFMHASLSFEQMVSVSRRQSDFFRLTLFKEYVNLIKPVHRLQRAAVAQFALELYVRIQSRADRTNTSEFVAWFRKLKSEGLLAESAVERLCKDYGWEEPLLDILEPPALFNVKMENDNVSEAISVLAEVRSSDDFSRNALRVYKSDAAAVVRMIKDNPELIAKNVIPILSTRVFTDQIVDFFRSHALKYAWLRHLYALQLAKCRFESDEATDDLIRSLCYNSQFSAADVEFAVRCLVDAGKFGHAALVLIEKGDYVYASSVLSHGDTDKAFDLIPTDISIDVRRRCVLRILRSMNRSDAEKLALRLLNSSSGVDIITILEYLPDSTKISELRRIIPVYIAKNKRIIEEQNRVRDEALRGINDSNKLAKARKDRVISLPNMQLCSKCGKRLLTDAGVVFPCTHSFHDDCLSALSESGEEHLDCPICGFSSVRMIDQPFEPDWGSRSDPWTTDECELRRIIS